MNYFVESDDVATHNLDSRNVSPASDQMIVYINSGSEDTEFDSSDKEPLAKYRTKTELNLSKEGNGKSDPDIPRGCGRPRGKAQPKKRFQTAGFNKIQRNMHRDRVDKECTRLGIVYRRWKPLNPEQESHLSVMLTDSYMSVMTPLFLRIKKSQTGASFAPETK